VAGRDLLPSCSRHGDPTNWASLHCPSNSSDGLPTPTYGSDQIVFTVCVKLNISAPLIDVYNAAGVLPPFNTTSNEVLTVLDYANAAGRLLVVRVAV
jgi:hypothetical protein